MIKGSIAIPQTYREAIATCCVIDRGPKANREFQVGDLVVMEGAVGDRYLTLNEKRDFMIDDQYVIAKIHNKKVYPIGNTILFERDTKEVKQSEIIVSAERYQTQSMFGWIRRHGLLRPGEYWKMNDVKVGERACLKGWEQHMKELYLDGKYYLIVRESDLLYSECN